MQVEDLLHPVSERLDQESPDKVPTKSSASPLEILLSTEEKREKKKDKQTLSEFGKASSLCWQQTENRGRGSVLEGQSEGSAVWWWSRSEWVALFTPVPLGLTRKASKPNSPVCRCSLIIHPPIYQLISHRARGAWSALNSYLDTTASVKGSTLRSWRNTRTWSKNKTQQIN